MKDTLQDYADKHNGRLPTDPIPDEVDSIFHKTDEKCPECGYGVLKHYGETMTFKCCRCLHLWKDEPIFITREETIEEALSFIENYEEAEEVEKVINKSYDSFKAELKKARADGFRECAKSMKDITNA